MPNNATLVIVGAVKHEDAQKLARKYYKWIPRQDDHEPVTIREPKKITPRTVVIDDENAPAGMVEKIWLTIPLGHKDETVLDLLSSILGGGNSSRLYRDIVAEKQLAVGDALLNAPALLSPLLQHRLASFNTKRIARRRCLHWICGGSLAYR